MKTSLREEKTPSNGADFWTPSTVSSIIFILGQDSSVFFLNLEAFDEKAVVGGGLCQTHNWGPTHSKSQYLPSYFLEVQFLRPITTWDPQAVFSYKLDFYVQLLPVTLKYTSSLPRSF